MHYCANPAGFTVKHYAGDVTYSTGNLGEANRDSLNRDLILTLKGTQDKLLAHLFQDDVDEDNKKSPPTASTRIRTQCASLVQALMKCAPHYIRCIKSNDSKTALSVETSRVKHQVQYLGLVENIRVRRAGFAYRAEYHRFLERFAMLCPQTYPEWRGADKDGCRAILKHVAAGGLVAGLTKEEAQLGASKIFVRQPETYFALERLLDSRRGEFASKIQRAYRKYTSSKEYVVLSGMMARLYKTHGKMRRRDSIFRPFAGDYLMEMDAALVEVVRDGLFRVVDYYDEHESLLFVDASCGIVVGAGAVERALLAVTSKALYVCTVNAPAPTWTVGEGKAAVAAAAGGSNNKPLPVVVLKRRVLVASQEKGQKSRQQCFLQSVVLSKLADETVGIKVRPHAPLAQPMVSHWVPDAAQKSCSATGTSFSLFQRRHHCRVCGQLYIDAACDSVQAVPDMGHYSPVRVCDACVGVESTSPCEDLVLLSARRTELVSVLRTAWSKCVFRDDELGIAFQNGFRLARHTAAGDAIIDEVVFTDAARSAVLVPGFGVSLAMNGRKLVIASFPGLPQDVVEDKKRRQAARQKVAADKRKRIELERAERNAQREMERGKERLQRLADKRARKQSEREAAQRAAEASAASAASGDRLVGGGKKFGTASAAGVGPKPDPGAGGELAAKMAKMRARAGGD